MQVTIQDGHRLIGKFMAFDHHIDVGRLWRVQKTSTHKGVTADKKEEREEWILRLWICRKMEYNGRSNSNVQGTNSKHPATQNLISVKGLGFMILFYTNNACTQRLEEKRTQWMRLAATGRQNDNVLASRMPGLKCSRQELWQRSDNIGRMAGMQCSQELWQENSQALIPLIGNNSRFNYIHG